MFYIDYGCPMKRNDDDMPVKYQIKSSLAFVRCCSNDGLSCQTIRNCMDSDQLVTYDAAVSQCDLSGNRLCTKNELSNVCCATGGGCDRNYVWTSTLKVASPGAGKGIYIGDINLLQVCHKLITLYFRYPESFFTESLIIIFRALQVKQECRNTWLQQTKFDERGC